MTKSLVMHFQELYRALLLDCADQYPSLVKEFDRDVSRLESLSVSTGEKLYTFHLPNLGKVLDQALESEVLTTTALPLTRPVNRRTMIPRLFRGLWSMVFAPDGCLKPDVDVNVVRLLRTLCFAGKKYNAACSDTATFLTVKEFFDVEAILPPCPSIWDEDGSHVYTSDVGSLSDLDRGVMGALSGSDSSGETGSLLELCQQVADRTVSLFGEFNAGQARFRHGPGAVSDGQTGSVYKYAFPNWSPRLQTLFPASVFAFANLRSMLVEDDYEYGGLPHQEPVSRLHAVPKTQKGPRLIASEPTCNQWCQQSVRHSLADAISACYVGDSIDFRRQDLSSSLVVSASMDRSLATIDLSSASDRLSAYVVQRLFRRNLSYLEAFVATRTRYMVQDIDKKHPKLTKLRKFASMGSALTFPVQSICFYIVCVAAGAAANGYGRRLSSNILSHLGRQVRVYGDDLIVPVSWVPWVEQLMKLLMLKVNRSKTFVNGKFRESCGTDAYDGTVVSPGQVRQFYSQLQPSSIQSVVDASNNLYLKGFIRASDAVLSAIPPGLRKLIPWKKHDSEDFGLISGSGFRSLSKTRWNESLHRKESLALGFLSKRDSSRRQESEANLLQFFTEEPSESGLSDWTSGLVAKPLTVMCKRWVVDPV